LRWSDIPFKPSSRTLRQFAGLWTGVFLLLGAWQGVYLERWKLAVAFAVVALTVGPLGLVWPRLIRPVYVGALVLSFPLNWVASHLALASFFYGVLTPLGVLFRLAGRDALCLKRPINRDTYWIAKAPARDGRRYFQQF